MINFYAVQFSHLGGGGGGGANNVCIIYGVQLTMQCYCKLVMVHMVLVDGFDDNDDDGDFTWLIGVGDIAPFLILYIRVQRALHFRISFSPLPKKYPKELTKLVLLC